MPPEASDAPPRLALLALSCCYFTLAVASLSVVGLLKPMAAGLAVSESAIAYLVTAFALTYAVCAPVIQVIVGDWDRRVLILIGLGLIGCGSLITAFGEVYSVTVTGRFVMAAGAAVVGPMASAAGAALVPASRRGAALGRVFAGLTIAAVLGVPITAWLGAQIGWRATLVVIAGLAAAVALAVCLTVPGGARGTRSSARMVLGVLTDRTLAPALSVTLFQMAGQFATYAVVAVYLTQRFGMSGDLLPAALFTYGVGGVLGNILATRLVDRFGPDRLILGSLSMIGLVFLAQLVIPATPVIAFALMLVWAISGMVLFAPQQVRLMALAPERGTLLLALNGAGLYVGMAGGAALSGLLLERVGVSVLPAASAILISAAIIGYLLSRRQT